MNIVRYQPTNIFDSVFGQLNSEMNNVFKRSLQNANNDAGNVTKWSPAVDIKEEDSQYVVVADIPGVDPENIEITMDNNVLTVKGERKHEASEEQDGFKRVERVRGSFYRSFNLPETADANAISAKGEHGVLTISIPKKEKAQPRRIAIAA